jgi:hypothetical protein
MAGGIGASNCISAWLTPYRENAELRQDEFFLLAWSGRRVTENHDFPLADPLRAMEAWEVGRQGARIQIHLPIRIRSGDD